MKTKIRRRGFIRLAGILGGAGAFGRTFGVDGNAAAEPAKGSPAQGGIEPNTIKRRDVGFHGYDPDRAFPGFTLFAPSANTNKTVYLIDLQGDVVHSWDMPYPPFYGYLTDRGTLFCNAKIPNPSFVGRAPYMCGAALEADWKGRVLWEVHHPDHTHDGIRLRNGNVLLICKKPLPDAIVPQVRGGRPGSEIDNGKMIGDYLVEMTTDGKIVWEWQSWEHLDPVKRRHNRRPGQPRRVALRQWVLRIARREYYAELPQHLDGRDDRSPDWGDLLEARCAPALRPACADHPA
jgi:hypothetical protein